MTSPRFLPTDGVQRLVETLARAGMRVFGPARLGRHTEYRRVDGRTPLDLAAPLPALPLKALFLPPTETLFTWRREHGDVTITIPAVQPSPAVVIGARPCDAAGVAILDKVMGWDYRDDAWFARREATTIVALACAAAGPDCFCESVGLGPASAKGADVMLTPAEGGYTAEALTEKGEKLFEAAGETLVASDALRVGAASAGHAEAGGQSDVASGHPVATVPVVDAPWDDPIWDRLGLRCHGCGACAAVCPTCHCFDIVDEPDGPVAGARRRNWDTCQAAVFTRHASGHNPRAEQRSRFRQRVLHKFVIYPQRFGEVLCTGCGRCAAACPAGQDMAEVLTLLRHV